MKLLSLYLTLFSITAVCAYDPDGAGLSRYNSAGCIGLHQEDFRDPQRALLGGDGLDQLYGEQLFGDLFRVHSLEGLPAGDLATFGSMSSQGDLSRSSSATVPAFVGQMRHGNFQLEMPRSDIQGLCISLPSEEEQQLNAAVTAKKQRRMERNRASAAESRQRKKEELAYLKHENNGLRTIIQDQSAIIESQDQKIKMLEAALALAAKQQNVCSAQEQ